MPKSKVNDQPLQFHEVAIEELKAIEARRVQACGATSSKALNVAIQKYQAIGSTDSPESAEQLQEKTKIVRLAALEQHLAGITFSGGGIRSATFAVGILQGLASLGLLRRFDYMSTVSGGGYAGAWLAAWIKRDGDPSNVERQLKPSRVQNAKADRGEYHEETAPVPYLDKGTVVDEEPEPLYHLREFSSFMMPRPGAFSPDTWTIIAIWLRNILINLLELIPWSILLVLGVRSVVWLYSPSVNDHDWVVNSACVLSLVTYFIAFSINALGTGEIRARASGERDSGTRLRRIIGEGRGIHRSRR